MYPFEATQFLHQNHPDTVLADWHQRYQQTTGDIMLIFSHRRHWVVLQAVSVDNQTTGSDLQWTLWDGSADCPQAGDIMYVGACIAHRLSMLFEMHMASFQVTSWFDQTLPFTCGTIALAHMASLLGVCHFDQQEELDLHLRLLAMQHPDQTFAAFGNDSLNDELATLLRDKGVPRETAPDRAQMVLAKLGQQQVQQILTGKNPWAALKAAANRPGVMFRLVTPDELTRYVANRARAQHGADIRQHKQKKKASSRMPPSQLQVDPAKLVLDADFFQDDDGEPVPQLHFHEIEAEQRGIALCSVQQAYKFLEQPKSISVEALALVLVDQPSEEVIKSADLRKFAVPAFCPGTEEHTLIFGYILQLGDQKVRRKEHTKIKSPEIVPTCVVKFQVYKDQYEGDWHWFLQAPIKSMVHQMDSLKLCQGNNCGADCPRFHPGLDEPVDNVLFEVWARACFNDKGAKCEPQQATCFTVFVRIPDGALTGVLGNTPVGIYAEPRGEQPREHDARYRVIWLPGASFGEAAHKCRTCNKSVSLVRLRQKYGVRVLQEDEAAAWATLRPGMDYVNLAISKIYELSPVPHGTQRLTIAKLLREWEWPARPLQPGRGTTTYMSWRVGSATPPPKMVMQGFDVDIVIAQVKDLHQPPPKPKIIASMRTQKHLAKESSSSSSSSTTLDPWQLPNGDPWSKSQNKMPPVTNAGKTRLSEIKDQLCQDVTDKVRKELESHASSMEVDTNATPVLDSASNARIQALEVGVSELKQQNAQFLTWFHEAGDRMQKTEQSMGEMQQSLNQQQQDLQHLNTNFQSTVKQMKSDLSAELSSSFENQMTQLTALLEKRQRHDL